MVPGNVVLPVRLSGQEAGAWFFEEVIWSWSHARTAAAKARRARAPLWPAALASGASSARGVPAGCAARHAAPAPMPAC